MGMNELRKQHRAELDEMCLAIQPNKNCEIASRAIEIAKFWILKAENQAVQIRNLEERNVGQQQRIRGRWIKISPAGIYECSICGKNVMTSDIDAFDYCHGCGADMRGEEDG